MDYKVELQNNNIDLQSLINKANTLPDAGASVNLEAEITAQDSIISQIQSALEDKTSNDLDTSDATATAEDIATGKTAYVDGEKITGTHECVGGGSSGVDTCTVNFWNDAISYGVTSVNFIVTQLGKDGKVRISNTGELVGMNNASIPDVICGSLALAVPVSGSFHATGYKIYAGTDVVEDITNTEYCYFTIPDEGNAEIDISFGP